MPDGRRAEHDAQGDTHHQGGGGDDHNLHGGTYSSSSWAAWFAWVWCSYILAALDKVQIAEELSKVALAEIIVPVAVYAFKSGVENLSKNNRKAQVLLPRRIGPLAQPVPGPVVVKPRVGPVIHRRPG